MMKKLLFIPAILFSSITYSAPKTSYVMDLNIANQLAINVMRACSDIAKPASVVILDQSGNVMVSQRHETVGIHNLIAAQRKAFTAYSSKMTTLQFMRNAQNNLDSQNLTRLPELLLLGGGVPVVYKNQLLGAVGVAGAGGSIQDDKCAQQGIETTLKQI
ncbi:GlcG/HbpS family heme-binding protein [Acinetobacter sp. ANC 4636]